MDFENCRQKFKSVYCQIKLIIIRDTLGGFYSINLFQLNVGNKMQG